jgi:hypothetical protein
MSRNFKSFNELNEFLQKSGRDLALLVYPKLKFGAVFWIPDEVSGIGGEGAHPWVIVSDYRSGNSVVTGCLRTTSDLQHNKKRGLYQPANILLGLDKEGVILTGMRRPFDVQGFKYYRYEGQLPQDWLDQLKQHIVRGS